MKRSNLKDNINRVKKSKDAKTLVANFGYLSALQIASYIFPLITIPYLARVIGVDSFGKIAFAAAIMTWLKTVTDWGFKYTATRDVARNRNDKEKVSRILTNTLCAQTLLMIASLIVLCLAIYYVPIFRENRNVILVSFLLIPGRIIFPDWFFQALERMRYITILNITSKLVFTIAIFVFIKEKSDFILQPLFTSLGYMVAGVITMFIILKRWNYQFKSPKWTEIKSTIQGSTDVFINNLMPNLYNSFSILLLGFYGGSVANGKFDAGNKFLSVAQQFMTVMSRAFFPFLARRIDKHGVYVKINLFFALLFSLGLLLTAPLLIKWFYTPEFYDAIMVLRIISISIFFISLSNIYGTNYLIIEGYEKELRNITFISSIIGFGLSFPLIYYFNFIGAALTITMTRGILGISIFLKYKKIRTLKKNIS